MVIRRYEPTKEYTYRSLARIPGDRGRFGNLGIMTVTNPVTIRFPLPPFVRCIEGDVEVTIKRDNTLIETTQFGVLPPGSVTFTPIRPPAVIITAVIYREDEIDEKPLPYVVDPSQIEIPLRVKRFGPPIGTICQAGAYLGLPPNVVYDVIKPDDTMPGFVIDGPTHIIVTAGQGVATLDDEYPIGPLTVIRADIGLPCTFQGKNLTLDMIRATSTELKPIQWM